MVFIQNVVSLSFVCCFLYEKNFLLSTVTVCILKVEHKSVLNINYLFHNFLGFFFLAFLIPLVIFDKTFRFYENLTLS